MSTSVSNQGRQRGRAKGLTRIKNLNRGQKLGYGKARMAWPGLNKPAFDRDRNKQQISKMTKEDLA